MSTPRSMVVWCPDWPVIAAIATDQLATDAPIVVLDRGRVHACSAAAREFGVRRGMRRRDAQAACPEVVEVTHRPESELAVFDDVLAVVEDTCATVVPIRPGLCATTTSPRFHGNEERQAAVLAERLVSTGVWDCRIGVADDLFTAEQAARQAEIQSCTIVAAGRSAEHLAPLPVEVLDDPELAKLLRRLGIRRVGEFAALSRADVATRFGEAGARLHRLARGGDPRSVAPRTPPTEFDEIVRFEPPVDNAEVITFSSRTTAEALIANLDRCGLVCAVLRIECIDDEGRSTDRRWAHPRWFTSREVVDRLHWQLRRDNPRVERRGPRAPLAEVRFVPEQVEAVGTHADTVFGAGTDERVELGVGRLQGMLGPEGVLRPSVIGGRDPGRRQRLTPWGFADAPAARRPARARAEPPPGSVQLPWPGSIPPPAPARILDPPIPVRVCDESGRSIRMTERGGLSGAPRWLLLDGRRDAIDDWAGPWPVDESWWDPGSARQLIRCQFVAADGRAWLASGDAEQWRLEAQYE
ncbi:DNA polymerase Y family protein [Enemella evansiae]|uniref:DNA polymerase Y family protein n=1 Tax=Enemella evansiae TaxID=2016499 RepID=UPI000B9628E0|nr:DNA polymerase Y family protein [Enemella evansiae]OYO01178.1 DNA polymerase [Enemella evansiae]